MARQRPQGAPVVRPRIAEVKRSVENNVLPAFNTSPAEVPKMPVLPDYVVAAPKPVYNPSPVPGAPSKTGSTVSVAGIFKHGKNAGNREKKHHKLREDMPEMLRAFVDGIDEAQTAISDHTTKTFQEIQNQLQKRIEATKKEDEAFLKQISNTIELLDAPLSEERLEMNLRRGDKNEIKVVLMCDLVEKFKKLVDKEEAKLHHLWHQWDDIQDEYIELGIEVFGPRVFGELADEYRGLQGGYKNELESLDAEHHAKVEELDAEIAAIGTKIMQKWKASEKELDVVAKREQTLLLQKLMES